jgi:hypothetical protein
MKMPQDTYDSLLEDCRAVLEASERGLGAFSVRYVDSGPPERDLLGLADMWDIVMVVGIDRSHVYHPRFDAPGMLPRVLEHDGRSLGWLVDPEPAGLDLKDVHVETALKGILAVLQSEPAAVPETAPAI